MRRCALQEALLNKMFFFRSKGGIYTCGQERLVAGPHLLADKRVFYGIEKSVRWGM